MMEGGQKTLTLSGKFLPRKHKNITLNAFLRYFWEIVHSFSYEEKKKLLFFATGSDRVSNFFLLLEREACMCHC